MAKKKMKAQTVNRAISAKELKFWLEGILEFQDDNWVPTAEQWKNIQDKIFSLQDTPEFIQSQPTYVPQAQPRGAPVVAPSSIPQMGNPFLPNGGVAGHAASSFPVGSDENPLPPVGVSSLTPDIPQGPMPVRDAKGFYKMPDEVGVGEGYVPASGGKIHTLKHGFE